MNVSVGVSCIAAGVALGAGISFLAWRRLPAEIALGGLAAAGALAGMGALLVQEEVGPLDWVVTLATLAILAPAHSRRVFGPPGARG